MALQEEEFETHDIYLAAYLQLAGCTLVRRRKQGPRVYFVFVNPGGSVKDLREAFYNSSAHVSAYSYSQKVVAMKQLCFEG